MFHIKDLPDFFIAFFLILPVISILHELGHVIFAWIMGGKNIRVSIGTGKTILKWRMLELRKYYFWYGVCTYDNVKTNKRFSNILIFAGGSLFNFLSVLAVYALLRENVISEAVATYQFTYFSWYYIFFAMLPMQYPDGNFSDGKIILDLIKGRTWVLKQRIYRIKWDKMDNNWHVFDHNNQFVNTYKAEKEAIYMAQSMAGFNRPSKIVNITDGDEKEVDNYPRIPL